MTRSSAVPVRRHGQILKPVPIEEVMYLIGQARERIARRAYEIYETCDRQDGHALEHWVQAESELLRPVEVCVHQSDSNVIIQFKMGCDGVGNLKVGVAPSRVAIAGTIGSFGKSLQERSGFGSLRPFYILSVSELPVKVKAQEAQALFENGIVEVSIPKETLRAVKLWDGNTAINYVQTIVAQAAASTNVVRA